MEGLRLTRRAAIGASTSIICPYFVGRGFFADCEFCILDTMVVDQVNYWHGSYDLYATSQYIEYLIHLARSENCLPILLLLPHKAAVPVDPGAAPPLVSMFYRSLALRNGCALLDLMPALRSLRSRDSNAFNDAYVDANHPNGDISSQVATTLARYMLNFRQAECPSTRTLVSIPTFSNIKLPEFQPVVRSSSLMETTFQRLHTGDVVDVEIGDGSVHGAFVNYGGGRSAMVRIEGQSRVVKLLGDPTDPGREFVGRAIPLVNPVKAKNGRVSISVEPASTPASESSQAVQGPVGNSVEIAELIVEYAPRILDYDFPSVPPAIAEIPFTYEQPGR